MSRQIDDIVLRAARAADESAVRRLALLDSSRPLRGDVLVAEVGGHPVAAVSLADGRVVADPFERTADAVALLRLRAEGLAGAASSPPRRGLRVL
ncbi:MAG TPA: hypothetical protein VHB30_08110, partial [Solirubrobacteraceae bacterium]|nr:hypothetical protein [Solirubrobacteraceae bacterium]